MRQLTTEELLMRMQEQRGRSFMEGLGLALQAVTEKHRDDRLRATRPLTDWELHLERLRRTAPEAYELVIQLPEEYQRGLRLFFPIWGEEPFVGVEINGKGMMPAEPGAYGICKKLMQMLWEEDPRSLVVGMEEAWRKRRLYPKDAPDENPEELIDASSPLMSVSFYDGGDQ